MLSPFRAAFPFKYPGFSYLHFRLHPRFSFTFLFACLRSSSLLTRTPRVQTSFPETEKQQIRFHLRSECLWTTELMIVTGGKLPAPRFFRTGNEVRT